MNNMYEIVRKPLKEVFGIKEASDEITVPVRVYDDSHPNAKYVTSHIPKKIPYLFRREIIRDIVDWVEDDDVDPALFFGPTGSGKSSLATQIAARLNIPVWGYTASEETELSHIFGQFTIVKDGSMAFMDGPGTLAAKFGGWFLMDEVDRISAQVGVGMNGFLQMEPFDLPGNSSLPVVPQPGFRIIGTANTNLAGDTRGSYNTAQVHDISFSERFGLFIEVEYPGDDDERALLEGVFSHIPDDELKYWFEAEGMEVSPASGGLLVGQLITRDEFINALLKFRGMVRAQSVDGGFTGGNAFERSMSTRVLLRWAKKILSYSSYAEHGYSAMHYALERTYSRGCTGPTQVAVHQLLKTVFTVENTKPANS